MADAERPRVNRDRIAHAALAIIDTEGLEALSMRRLAAALDVQAMSLYSHVSNKDDVVGLVIIKVIQEVELPPFDPDRWREGLIEAFGRYRRVLLRHPNAVPAVTRRPMVGDADAYVAAWEYSIQSFMAGGLSAETAVDAHRALLGLTIGLVINEVNFPRDERGRPIPAMTVDRELFPGFAAARRPLDHPDFDRGYAMAVHALLDGLVAG